MRKLRGGRMASWLPQLLLPLLALPALWPLWRIGLPRTADGTLHLLRVALLDYHVSLGMLYPRWLPELVLGYGYPLFNFYGPVTYYVAEFLHLLGLRHSTALIVTFGLLILVGGYGAYLLARDLFRNVAQESSEKLPASRKAEAAALIAAVAYMYTPYLLTNVYMRGALAEVGAQALLPWIFWSFRRLLQDEHPARYVVPAALSLGGLAAAHNITLLWIPATLLGYIGVLWWPAHGVRTLLWPLLGGLAALGVSAFFWAPLIFERAYLSGVAFEIAATYMGENVWTWRNFLDWHLPFDYTLSIPFQLGGLQLLLALGGFVLVRPKHGEWWYWLVLTLVGMLGISAITLPIWLNSELLLIAQFPWRLLSIISLPLALMTGGLVSRLPDGWPSLGVTVAVLALVIATQRPQADAMSTLIRAPRNLSPAEVAQFELDTSAYGTSSASEFLPRWAGRALFAPLPSAVAASPFAVDLAEASPFRMLLRVEAAEAGPLHFATFYFPGWQVALDGAPVVPYPEPARGMLTVDVPAGSYTVEVGWRGTRVQHTATLISLLTLALLVAWAVWTERRRPGRAFLLAVGPGLLLAWGVVASRPAPAAHTVQPPAAPVTIGGLTLLGTYALPADDGWLMVHPTWLVEAPPADVTLAWTLANAAGVRYPLMTTAPFFNTLDPAIWQPATVVDDAYRLALPPDLQAGDYTLQVSVVTASGATAPVDALTLALPASPPASDTSEVGRGWRYGENAGLDGVALAVNGRAVDWAGAAPPVVAPGDRLEYRLRWRSAGYVDENYHAFLHLVDREERPLLQGDQLPGPVFSPPRLWNPYRAAPDSYRFTVPAAAPSGLYRGAVGLYHFATGERLPVYADDGTRLGDRGLLPPVKIVNSAELEPATRVDAAFAGLARLEGYTLTPASGGVRAGETLTVTLHYRAEGPTAVPYTQFVHLYDPALGMAAQRDAQPADGGNPTTVWQPEEVIVEEVPLTVAADAAPGTYQLLVGFYDAAGGAARVPVADGEGSPQPNDQVLLTPVEVGK